MKFNKSILFALVTCGSLCLSANSVAANYHFGGGGETSTSSREANESTQARVHDLFHWVNHALNPKNPLTQEDVNNYFASDFKQYSNGRLEVEGSKGVFERFEALRANHQEVILSNPEDLVVEGHKAAARFTATFVNKQGVKRTMDKIGIMEFNEEGKLSRCYEAYQGPSPMMMQRLHAKAHELRAKAHERAHAEHAGKGNQHTASTKATTEKTANETSQSTAGTAGAGTATSNTENTANNTATANNANTSNAANAEGGQY